MRRDHAVVFVPVLLLLFAACGGEPAHRPQEAGAASSRGPISARAEVAIDAALLAAFAPLPEVMADPSREITEAKVELGRMLYHDERLSLAQDISCNSCHALDSFGDDGRATSEGHGGQLGGRNAPTVYNAAGHVAQFWDGRAADVEEQAKGPVLNPIEMAMPDEASVVRLLTSIPGYVEAFEHAFPGTATPVTYDHFGEAVGAFERRLVTPSRWDAYLHGDRAALTEAEAQGFRDFVSSGCTACHSGPYVGGATYQKLGLVRPWPDSSDAGRFDVTGREADRMVFKVPSLRNVAETAPYFHDGSVGTLEDAVRLMGEHQLGRTLDADRIASIVAWLRALSGQPPADLIARPELPPDGPGTPGPAGSPS